MRRLCLVLFLFFFFNDTATTEIYTLSLHDALPICCLETRWAFRPALRPGIRFRRSEEHTSELQSHSFISYAVFCLKKKKNRTQRVNWGLRGCPKRHGPNNPGQ